MRERSRTIFRLALLLALTSAWAWAGSVFAPWATSPAPRLWLYDTLFYLRFLLLFWGMAELLHALATWRRSRSARKALLPLAWLGAAAAVALAAFALDHSSAALRLKIRWSALALRGEIAAADSDTRHRAGWFIVDTRRHPCGGSPWLWLGQPFGGGTGTNRVLVHSGNAIPLSPDPDAFRFRPIADGWWMAYQHAAAYRRGRSKKGGAAARCVPGTLVEHHDAGLAFIADGQRIPTAWPSID